MNSAKRKEDERHAISIGHSRRGSHAFCLCGWNGVRRLVPSLAKEDGAYHIREVSR